MDALTIIRIGMVSIVLPIVALIAWHVYVGNSTEGMSPSGVALYAILSTGLVALVIVFILKWREEIFSASNARERPHPSLSTRPSDDRCVGCGQ